MSIKAEEQVLPVELEELERLRRRVLALAEERGLTQKDMEKAARVAHSTYDGMWKRGTVTLLRLERIANRLGMDLIALLRDGEGFALQPKAAYIEDRMAEVETKVRQLELQLRKR